jgi:hypothetical protein
MKKPKKVDPRFRPVRTIETTQLRAVVGGLMPGCDCGCQDCPPKPCTCG